ncbi:hypothetical protein EPUL_003858 [Erysiphe pulchra]|uniref:Chloride channel protein n=1 Tax=Erysiphe pulchra TaxID=225359 RepID=A0A2S4PNX9_9PEZI|nr:hypothetical protein EPUL_003858 [Erysiphe pulchra]
MTSSTSDLSILENHGSSSSSQNFQSLTSTGNNSKKDIHSIKHKSDGEELFNGIRPGKTSFTRDKKKSRPQPQFLSAIREEPNLTLSPQSEELSPRNTGLMSPPLPFGTKDDQPIKNGNDNLAYDWLLERSSQRVGYEDMTAIDWIFEYSKERQRLQNIRVNSSGLDRFIKMFWDSSQVWIVLILTGLAAGTLAAAIDISSDWLGNIKTGYCTSGQDGSQFYLNKYFCCFGFDEFSQCEDWITWNKALGIRSTKGSWLIAYLFFILFSVLFATIASFLVKEYAIYAKHSGIPEIKTILGGFIIRRFMGPWTLVIKSLGLCLAVASGMWLGKEGPLVHVACCCAKIFMRLFKNISHNEARKREVISAAAATGISVAFGSPIGGVLFSLEQLSYYFPDKTMWQSFVCAMTGAVILQALDPFRSGKLVMYQVTYSSGWHGFEMIPFFLLGIFGGIYGGVFIKLNMKIAEWRKNTYWLPGPIIQVFIVALLTALINFPNIYMRAQSSELLYSLFAECSEVTEDQFGLCKSGSANIRTTILLVFAAVLGFLLASITFGLQIPAGIILPSMTIGALFGRAVGILMEIWVRSFPHYFLFANCEPDIPCVTPGTYAVVGAAAALGGVTRMTVSIVVIMFELTGALTYVLPIMIAVMLSKWIGDSFGKRGIYESWIYLNEYPFLDNSEETFVPDIPVSQMMTRIECLVVLTATGHTIKSIMGILASHPFRGFPVISNQRDAILLGYISRAELIYNLHTSQKEPQCLSQDTRVVFTHQPQEDPNMILDLRQWMDQTPLTLPSQSNLSLTVTYFQKLGLRYVFLCDRGALQGLMTKKDVWFVLNMAEKTRETKEEISALAREDHDGENRGLLSHDQNF